MCLSIPHLPPVRGVVYVPLRRVRVRHPGGVPPDDVVGGAGHVPGFEMKTRKKIMP